MEATVEGEIIKLVLDNDGRRDTIHFNVGGEWSDLVIGLERLNLKSLLAESIGKKNVVASSSIIGKKYVFERESVLYCATLNKTLDIHWNIDLKGKKMLSLLFNGVDVNSKPFHLEQSSVTYKSVNKDVIAVALESSETSINVLFVSGLTGRILHDFYVYNVDLKEKPSFAFLDNYFVLSYLKKLQNFSRSEATIVEILQETKEKSVETV